MLSGTLGAGLLGILLTNKEVEQSKVAGWGVIRSG